MVTDTKIGNKIITSKYLGINFIIYFSELANISFTLSLI
ncbi:hypothetical protein M100_2251 [Bacteroides fragilis str. 1007-1-F |nr:hypothetical protein M100_2251 [Bacteroides fragilis str. 1007-1-F \